MDIFVWIKLTVFVFVFNGPTFTSPDYPSNRGSSSSWKNGRQKTSSWQNYGSSFGKLQNQATILPTEVDTALTFTQPNPTSVYPPVFVPPYNDPSYSRATDPLVMEIDFYSNHQIPDLVDKVDSSFIQSSFGRSKTPDELFSVTPPLTGSTITNTEPDSVMDFAAISNSLTPFQSATNTFGDSSLDPISASLSTPVVPSGYETTEYSSYIPGIYQTNSTPNESSTTLVKPIIYCNSLLLPMLDITMAACQLRQQTGDFFCFDEFRSCKDSCGQSFPSTCSCDVYCEIYDNCCDDFKAVCPNVWNESKERFSSLLEVNVSCLKYNPGYLVIASCPPNTNTTEEYKCQHDSEMPISVDNFHFKNIHCLRCNSFKDENSILWSVDVSVYFEDFAEENAFFIGDGVFEHLSNTGVFAWKTPTSANNLHTCNHAMISSCPPGTNSDLQDKCRAIHAPVTVVETTPGANKTWATSLYGNKYCAECNVVLSYVCVGSTRKYRITNQGHGRFSNIINWHISDNITILSSGPMSQWKTMSCNGNNFDLMSTVCKMEVCHSDIDIVNNKCSISLLPHCAKFTLKLGLHQSEEPTCTNATCLHPLFHTIMETLINATNSNYSGMSLEEMAINTTNVQLSFHMKFKRNQGNYEAPTWPLLLSIYSPVVNDILTTRGFTGQFWFCAMSSRYDKCADNCLTRNYTIYGPVIPRPAVSSSSVITQPLLLIIICVAICTKIIVTHSPMLMVMYNMC